MHHTRTVSLTLITNRYSNQVFHLKSIDPCGVRNRFDRGWVNSSGFYTSFGKRMWNLCIFCDRFGLKWGKPGLFWPLCNATWRGGHFGSHGWRWVNIPPDLAWSFCMTCANYQCRTLMHAWYKSTQERQHMLNGIAWLAEQRKNLEVQEFTFHIYRQDGCHGCWFPL